MSRTLGINLGCYGDPNFPAKEQVRLMKENGFTATFCGSERALTFEAAPYLQEAGIVFDNLHAPFDKINDIWSAGEEGDVMLDRLVKSVDACVRVGAKALVVHLSAGDKAPHVNDYGVDRFEKLMQKAAAENIFICYENQRKLSNLAMAFEQFPDQARFCWDCGHESCFTPGRHYMPIFGHKLGALHIHDNMGIYNADNHMVPGDAKMDFDYVAEQIALSGYPGTLMLELLRKKTDYYNDWTPEQYYAHAAERARELRAKIEAYEARQNG